MTLAGQIRQWQAATVYLINGKQWCVFVCGREKRVETFCDQTDVICAGRISQSDCSCQTGSAPPFSMCFCLYLHFFNKLSGMFNSSVGNDQIIYLENFFPCCRKWQHSFAVGERNVLDAWHFTANHCDFEALCWLCR